MMLITLGVGMRSLSGLSAIGEEVSAMSGTDFLWFGANQKVLLIVLMDVS